MSDKKSGLTINENTTLPLGLVATLLGTLVGATAYSSFWLATFIASVSAATDKNIEQDKNWKVQAEINTAVIHVLERQQHDVERLKKRAGIKD